MLTAVGDHIVTKHNDILSWTQSNWLIPMEPVGVMTSFQIPRVVIHLCYITGNYFPTVCTLITLRSHDIYQWNCFNSAISKVCMLSAGDSALLPRNVDQRPPLQHGLINFQYQNFQLYDKSLKDWSLRKQLIFFQN